MDCEKFEATLIDELYDELDELTSAAAKRHVAGCSRCAALLSGLRATRRLAVLPIVEPSADLEERILSATRDAQKVVPIGRRFSRFVSWAGNWAMRPQTAMAAVFILMVGSSVLLVRGRHAPASASVTVTEQGAPVASVAAPAAQDEDQAALDPRTAAAAHGAGLPPVATATAFASAAPADSAIAGNDLESANGVGRAKTAMKDTPAQPLALDDNAYGSANASTPAGAPYAPPPPMAQAAGPAAGGGAPTYGYGGSSGAYAEKGAADKKEARRDNGNPAFDNAMSFYRAGNYADATRGWDALAPSDPTSALWAARAVRDGNGGCAVAKDRFDQVASRSWGTTVGYDATLEGGQCYRAVGALETARVHFSRLLTVQAYASRAQAEIDALTQSQVAARSRPAESKPKAATPPPARAPQASPPAASTAPAKSDVSY